MKMKVILGPLHGGLNFTAYDTARVAIEAGRSRPADSEFVLDSIPQEWRKYVASIDDLGLAEEKWHAG